MADAPGQARSTVRQGAEYVTILMGANDLCGWDGTLTPTATFRAQFTATLEILRAVCATWSNCRFDNYLTYSYNFTRSMVSKLDYFHPSLSGQAALTWSASWRG